LTLANRVSKEQALLNHWTQSLASRLGAPVQSAILLVPCDQLALKLLLRAC
jgi:hypothetical protein